MKPDKIIFAVSLILLIAFLGIPVPDWLSNFVSSLAGIINLIITGFSKLISFIQLFVRF